LRLSSISSIRNKVPSQAVAGCGTDDFEIKILVSQVGLVLAQIADHAAGAGDGTGATQVDRIVFGEDADPLRALDKDAIAVEQPDDVGMGLGKLLDEVADHTDPLVVHVLQQATRRACN